MKGFLRSKLVFTLIALILLASAVAIPLSGSITRSHAASSAAQAGPHATFSAAKAFDVSRPLRELARPVSAHATPRTLPPERGPLPTDHGFAGDGALQATHKPQASPLISAPLHTFEGLANSDNPFQVSPPDPNGEVSPNFYVEMVNVVFAVYSKTGTRLLGPSLLGDLWSGFAVPDCTDLSGDPVVLYDQLEDRWLLSQFTTRGLTFYNCVAVSLTGDPTGAYFRYAFSTGVNFPDYPKYGLWRNMYIITTREFGPTVEYGIGVYGLERDKMLAGDPNARVVSFFLDSAAVPINLIGDGLLPADIDGRGMPANGAPAPLVGTQDDGGPYGATFDALNIWEFSVKWQANPIASINLKTQLPVASFDSIFPCAPGSRDCLP